MFEDLSEYRTRKYYQPSLFELAEKIPQQNLPYFSDPKTDNERLFNLQHDYYAGDEKVLVEMFKLLQEIAPKIVNIETKKRRLSLSKQQMDDMGKEAVFIFVEQFLKNKLVVKTSFIAYLRLQVLRVVFYQTKNQKFEKWLKQKKINYFTLSDFDKEFYKAQFEKEDLSEKEK